MRKIIKASEGHILTDGNIFGSIIYLAEGRSGEDFYEITEAEYEALQESEEATAEDYQSALRSLGVNI